VKRFLKITAIGVGVFAVALGAFTVWGYLPVAPFEPVAYQPRTPDHWPTEGWRRSTPEAQGMSSETLVEMMAAYEASRREDPELYIDSMTIVRNGYVVADFYTNPLYPRGALHILHSATKSIVSALVGIAIDRGHIESVDVRVVDVFGDREIRNLDQRKQRLTIRDLLSMETGLHSRDSYLYAHEGLFELQHTEDWLQFALDLPMAAEPGERFDYSNISTFLLSAILMRSTGMDTLEFARKHLFGPLGIEEVKWEWNSQDQPIAWARMWLRPDDLAKFGLLYLQRGRWNGEQIVAEDWVRDSLTPWAYPPNAVDILNADMTRNQDASTRNWVAQRFFRPFADGYGYQWWLARDGTYTALGTSGEYLMVAPEQNLVFVVMSKSRGIAQFAPAELFRDFVLPAVRSDDPLPENEPALAALRALAGPPALTDEASPVPDLPATALRISGATYALETNPFNTDDIRFVFDPDLDHAELSYTARESWDVDYRIGLDGVRRFTETNDSVFAAVGEWTSPNTFAVDVEIVGYSTFDRWEFTFEGDAIHVTEFSIAGDYTYGGRQTAFSR
jgi:CubicO group peptidase (beta-lactamase class C family)